LSENFSDVYNLGSALIAFDFQSDTASLTLLQECVAEQGINLLQHSWRRALGLQQLVSEVQGKLESCPVRRFVVLSLAALGG